MVDYQSQNQHEEELELQNTIEEREDGKDMTFRGDIGSIQNKALVDQIFHIKDIAHRKAHPAISSLSPNNVAMVTPTGCTTIASESATNVSTLLSMNIPSQDHEEIHFHDAEDYSLSQRPGCVMHLSI